MTPKPLVSLDAGICHTQNMYYGLYNFFQHITFSFLVERIYSLLYVTNALAHLHVYDTRRKGNETVADYFFT